MFNTNIWIQDKKESRKHVYINIFRVFKFWREEKKEDENTANSALNNVIYMIKVPSIRYFTLYNKGFYQYIKWCV